jgi:hypothetical protein
VIVGCMFVYMYNIVIYIMNLLLEIVHIITANMRKPSLARLSCLESMLYAFVCMY